MFELVYSGIVRHLGRISLPAFRYVLAFKFTFLKITIRKLNKKVPYNAITENRFPVHVFQFAANVCQFAAN
jgi:hypothetical protein